MSHIIPIFVFHISKTDWQKFLFKYKLNFLNFNAQNEFIHLIFLKKYSLYVLKNFEKLVQRAYLECFVCKTNYLTCNLILKHNFKPLTHVEHHLQKNIIMQKISILFLYAIYYGMTLSNFTNYQLLFRNIEENFQFLLNVYYSIWLDLILVHTIYGRI